VENRTVAMMDGSSCIVVPKMKKKKRMPMIRLVTYHEMYKIGASKLSVRRWKTGPIKVPSSLEEE
jgi:heterodisulfide reductase subunit A-like polyferredoxin